MTDFAAPLAPFDYDEAVLEIDTRTVHVTNVYALDELLEIAFGVKNLVFDHFKRRVTHTETADFVYASYIRSEAALRWYGLSIDEWLKPEAAFGTSRLNGLLDILVTFGVLPAGYYFIHKNEHE